jgi:hypothetical protein
MAVRLAQSGSIASESRRNQEESHMQRLARSDLQRSNSPLCVIPYTEIGGRVQSKALFQGDCQESNALWPSRDESDTWLNQKVQAAVSLACLLFAGALNKHYKRCEATINLSVRTSVASGAVMLAPAAVAVEQSISYSKVKLSTEIGGRIQSKVLYQGDCQESNASWPSRNESDTWLHRKVQAASLAALLFAGALNKHYKRRRLIYLWAP